MVDGRTKGVTSTWAVCILQSLLFSSNHDGDVFSNLNREYDPSITVTVYFISYLKFTIKVKSRNSYYITEIHKFILTALETVTLAQVIVLNTYLLSACLLKYYTPGQSEILITQWVGEPV